METKTFKVHYRSRKDEFRLYPIGDIHAGTLHCAEDLIKKQVKEIKENPHAIWIGMGDYADLITPKDPRWDVEVISPWVERSNVAESQRVWLVKLLQPIANKCVGLLAGNHEESIRRYNYQDIHLDLCRDLNVSYLGYTAFVRFQFIRIRNSVTTFIGAFQHGSGGAQTEGGKIMRLKKLMDSFNADICCMGHLHDIKTNVIPIMGIDESNTIEQKVKVGAITGSWMRAYTQGIRPSYAEIKGYTPSTLGCPHFVIIPDKNILQVIR